MVGKLAKLTVGLSFCFVMCIGTSAYAVTINQALVSVQAQTGVAGPVTFEFNDLSVADYFDLDSSGTVTPGDVVLGAFVVDEIVSSNGLGGTAPLTDVSGVYALEVAGTTPVGPPGPAGTPINASFIPITPGADAAVGFLTGTAPSTLLAPGEMFAVYQGGVSTNPNLIPASGSFYAGAFTDGDKYATLTPTVGYTINFIGDTLAALAGLTPGSTIGTILAPSGQDVVAGGLGDGGEGIGQLPLSPIGAFGSDVDLTGSILTSAGPSALPGAAATFSDTATFQITAVAVPLPPALLAGIPLLGFVVARTVRRHNA